MSDASKTIESSILKGISTRSNVTRATIGMAEIMVEDLMAALFHPSVRWAVAEYLVELEQKAEDEKHFEDYFVLWREHGNEWDIENNKKHSAQYTCEEALVIAKELWREYKPNVDIYIVRWMEDYAELNPCFPVKK